MAISSSHNLSASEDWPGRDQATWKNHFDLRCMKLPPWALFHMKVYATYRNPRSPSWWFGCRDPASWEVDLFASQISWYPELGTLNSHNHGFSEKWGLSPNHLVTFQKLLRLIFYVDEPTPDGSCLIKEFFWEKKHRNLLRKISFKPWTMLWTASPPCQCPIFWRFFWPGNGWKGEL